MNLSSSGSSNMSIQMNLSPTAQRLLEGARRLLERSGYSALTLEAIAKEAGETKSLIRYHFGSKHGLVVALVEWIMHEYVMMQRRLTTESSGGDGVRKLSESLIPMMLDESTYLLYFDLMSNLLRDPEMRNQAAALFRSWRHFTSSLLVSSMAEGIPKEVMTLTSMSIGLADGLALQLLADPKGVDVRQAMRLWEESLTYLLSRSGGAAESQRSAQGSSEQGSGAQGGFLQR